MRRKSFAGFNGQREPQEIEVDGRTFLTVESMNGMALLDLVDQLSDEDKSASALKEMIGDIVVEDQREAFIDHLRSSSVVDLPMIQEIMEWAMERYAERPTEQPSGSSPG